MAKEKETMVETVIKDDHGLDNDETLQEEVLQAVTAAFDANKKDVTTLRIRGSKNNC